jgi:hypothetical protein
MRRKRGTSEATFSVTGRDIEDVSYNLTWDRELCTWTITGQGVMKPILTKAQQQIIDLLDSEERIFTTAEIAKVLGIQKYEVSRQAAVLTTKGFIEKHIYGQWKAKLANIKTSDTVESPTPEVMPVEEPQIWRDGEYPQTAYEQENNA